MLHGFKIRILQSLHNSIQLDQYESSETWFICICISKKIHKMRKLWPWYPMLFLIRNLRGSRRRGRRPGSSASISMAGDSADDSTGGRRSTRSRAKRGPEKKEGDAGKDLGKRWDLLLEIYLIWLNAKDKHVCMRSEVQVFLIYIVNRIVLIKNFHKFSE